MIGRVGIRCAVLVVFFCGAAQAQSPQLDHFERKIRPVLVEQCQVCHSSALEQPMGGLRLDSRDAVRQGGASGPAVVPGQPAQSLLLKALTYKDANLKMPPSGKLADNVIADFEKWIADGAVDPRSTETGASAGGISKKKQDGPGTPIEEGRKWWAFQPLTEQAAPKTS